MSIGHVIGKKLAEKGVILVGAHNSIYTAAKQFGIESPVVKTALNGAANVAKRDIDRYRNMMLPAARELETLIKSKAKTTPTTIADKVNIHVNNYSDGLDAVESLGNIDTLAVVSFTELPENPLVIEYDKQTVRNNLVSTNNHLNTLLEEILMEYEEGYIEKFHNGIFGNVSSNNPKIRELAYDPVSSHNELLLGLMLTTGYLNGTLGVSNMPGERARVEYLYVLRNAFVTALARYRSIYKGYLASNTLISKIITKDDGITHVYLIGEVYSVYLNDHNVEPIIGCARSRMNASSVTLEKFLSDIESYQTYYNDQIRLASSTNTIAAITALRLAYKLSVRETLAGMSEDKLAMLGKTKEDVLDINNVVEKYIDELSAVSLQEITDISRGIIGNLIYSDTGFMVFVDNMVYYSKLFPKLTPDEVATAAAAAHVMNMLTVQLKFNKGE